jgi:polar amino acid transport system substrate-binding protein
MNTYLCRANDKVVSIGVADFPPYSIVDDTSISGVEVDIVQESLAVMGYRVKFVSYPYGRLPASFRSKKVDGTIVTLKNFPDIDVFYSGIVLPEYQTVAVHLKRNQLDISSIKDLQSKSILAHQRASLFYGAEYARIAEANKKFFNYQETARQRTQISMLFKDRVDVIVLAHEIFTYFKARSDYRDTEQEFVVSKIFGDKFGFHNVFWNEKVRDDFNQGLTEIKKNGTYSQILDKYLQFYKTAVKDEE